MRKNLMKQKLAEGKPVIGFTMLGNWPEAVEMLGYLGVDYVWLDGQHGVLGLQEMAGLVRAAENAGITPIARVPSLAVDQILLYLDLGVQGIIVPGVDTVEEAKEVVKAVKFYPEGMRGLGYGHFADYYTRGGFLDVFKSANAETSVILQCESVTGLENLDEIVRVPGVDIIMIGPMDLSQSLRLPAQFDHPLHIEAMAKARRIVIEAGKVVGEIGWSGDFARERMAEGVRFINFGVNDLLIAGITDYLTKARGEE